MTFELVLFWGAVIVLAGFLLGGVAITTVAKGEEFAGHPKGLFVLFLAEMWERFSYYGMRALLIFYLVQHWLFSDAEASVVYGAYTALVYITPVVGGYLADKYLGQRKAVLFGAVLLTCGHFLMAFEGEGGQADPIINIFWLALALIIVGSGFLKANISVIVGQLYPRTDVRRDAGYTIFYMGINVGAATASIICGYLGQTYGWQYGFGLAGIGMLIGLIFFVLGKPLLRGRGEAKDPVRLASPVAGLRLEWWMYAAGLGMVALCWGGGAVSGTGRLRARRLRRSAGALRALYRGRQAALRGARPHLCRAVPHPHLDHLLGAVRAGGLQPQPVYRSPCRPRGGRGIDVPVDQRHLHHPAGARVRRAVAMAGASRRRAFHPAQVRPRRGAGGAWLPGAGVGAHAAWEWRWRPR